MKLIHVTDTHFVNAGQLLYGLDPRSRLDAAVNDINKNHADAEFAVITGDLTHWGEADAYRSFADCIGNLRMPVVSMVGNHDRRGMCLEILKSAPRDPYGFVQGTRDTPNGRFIFLDTLDETTHEGRLCARRLAWLEQTLAVTASETPIFLFMHHPPFAVGVHAMDRIALADREQFIATIAPYSTQIQHLFFGHVHRPICGSWQGIPFSTQRGTNHQVAFDLADGPHLASHEPPAYAIVLIESGQTVVHAHDYLDQSLRFPFSRAGTDDRVYALGAFGS